MAIGMKANRECILNEIRMKLVEFEHNGIPKDVSGDQRSILVEAAALAVAAVEDLDAQALGDAL